MGVIREAWRLLWGVRREVSLGMDPWARRLLWSITWVRELGGGGSKGARGQFNWTQVKPWTPRHIAIMYW